MEKENAVLGKRFLLVLFCAVALFTAFFSWLAIARHDAFLTHTADLGQIDQAVWNSLHGRFVEEIKVDEISTRLTDHFEPAFISISLVFALWNDARALLFSQPLVLGITAFAIFAFVTATGRENLHYKESLFIALWAAIVYLWSPQIEAASVADFHASPLAALPLALFLYLGYRGKTLPAAVAAFSALLIKEEISLLVLTASLYLATARRWRPGWALVVIAALWFAIATFIVVPHYAEYYYGQAAFPYLARYENDTATNTTTALLPAIGKRLLVLADTSRLSYLAGLMLAFAGMPLLAPELLLVAAPLIAANTISNYEAMYSGEFHYSAPFMSIMACAAGLGLARWWRFIRNRPSWLHPASIVLVLIVPFAYHVAEGFSPLGREYYLHQPIITPHNHLLARFAGQIPDDAPLSTTPALHPHFSHRRLIYTYPVIGEADYILLDVTGTTDMHPNDLRRSFEEDLSSGFSILDAADGYILLSKTADKSVELGEEFLSFTTPNNPPETVTSVQFGTSLRLLGYSWVDDPKWDFVSLRLYWQPLADLPGNITPYVVFVNRWGEVITDSREQPFLETIWCSLPEWPAGSVVTTTTNPAKLGEWFSAYLGVVVDGQYGNVAARLIPIVEGNPPELIQSLNLVRLPPLTRSKGLLSRHQLQTANVSVTENTTPTAIYWPDGIALSAYFVPTTVDSGGNLRIESYWTRTTAPLQEPLSLSVRLADEEGNVVHQYDGPLHGGFYPISDWKEGELVGDSRIMNLPSDLTPGEYQVHFVLYNRETLMPLFLEDGSTSVAICHIQISESR